MSAMNIIKRRDVIHVIADGGHYDNDGRALSFGPKIDPIPQFPGFVSTRGRSVVGPLLSAMISVVATDTDEMFDKIEQIISTFEDVYADTLKGHGAGNVFIGGWSQAQQQMRLGLINGGESDGWREKSIAERADAIAPEIHTLQEFKGDRVLTTPPIADDVYLQAHGRFFYSVDELPNAEVYARAMITAQRTVVVDFPGGRSGCMVGGFGQLTTVTRDSVTTKIVARFDEDQKGEYMTPKLPIDWKAWHAANSADPYAGMSKLKREMAIKKAAKGKLRAVS